MQSEATRQRGIAIELRCVPEPIIHQLNMVIATRGTSQVALPTRPTPVMRVVARSRYLSMVATTVRAWPSWSLPPR